MSIKPSPIRILRNARLLIERGWTQGAEARDKNGDKCRCYDEEAVRFCLTGGAVSRDQQ